MGEKQVSILMVNYNHQDTIGEAIQSVMNQTYSNFRLVIVDDGSTDRSVEIVKGFEDERIELYQMDKNRHICEATNYGFTKIHGDYLARIDSDDIWKSNRLERQLDYMAEHPECRICFSWIDLIDETGTIINDKDRELLGLFETKFETQREWLRTFFYVGNCLCHSSVLMTRELMEELGEFNRGFAQSHDFDYWVRAAKRCSCMHVIQERLVSLRRYSEETINNSRCTVEQDTRFFNEYAEIRKHFFEDMSEEIFICAFGEDFKLATSVMKDELDCEKAFLLCTPINTTNSVPAAGIEALMKLTNNEKTKKLLEEKYNYTVKDFYKISCNHIYCDAYLETREETLEKVIHEKEVLKKEILIKQEEQKQLLRIIREYENSTSWKLTRPLRKAGERIKRVKNLKR